jgi:hypothetical protein
MGKFVGSCNIACRSISSTLWNCTSARTSFKWITGYRLRRSTTLTPYRHLTGCLCNMASPLTNLCTAVQRGPGGCCRRRAVKDQPYCRRHMEQRPAVELADFERDVLHAGAAAWRAKQKAKIARGEATRFPQGRKKRWLIPRPWRLQLSPADEARVLAHMVDYEVRVRGGKPRPPWSPITSQRDEAKALVSFERTFVLRLNDPVAPLSRDRMEQAYHSIYDAEQFLCLPGADVRLTRLSWEREQFYLRALNSSGVARASQPQPGAAKPEPPPRPSAHGVARLNLPSTCRGAAADDGSPPLEREAELAAEAAHLERHIPTLGLSESSWLVLMSELESARDAASRCQVLERWFASTQRAYAGGEAIIAGRDHRAQERAARPADAGWRPHSIAPWLRDR